MPEISPLWGLSTFSLYSRIKIHAFLLVVKILSSLLSSFFFIHTDFLNECTGGFIERPYLDLSDCFLVVSYFASLTLCISCDIEIGSKDLIRLRINAFQKEYFLSDLVYFIL